VTIRIMDDGQGFPAGMIGRIGDPFVRVRARAPVDTERPEYEGMGLGLFIAKTLLERSGAELSFSNGRDPYGPDAGGTGEGRGAIVQLSWPKDEIVVDVETVPMGLGENQPINV